MKVCILQHVPFEGAGTVLPYFAGRGQRAEVVHLYRGQALPAVGDFDLLVVMGGPMGVADVAEYGFLAAEKRLIAAAIRADKWVLGICLGAQLAAAALGADVRRMPAAEIGWYPVSLAAGAERSWLADLLPCQFDALHWHADRFDLPVGAMHVAGSAGCANQAFVFNRRVIGLQFHLEFTVDSTRALIEKSGGELAAGPWVQAAADILADEGRFAAANRLMGAILRHIEGEIEFCLDPRLAADCYCIAELDCARLLLHKNAAVPWFILVPRGGYRELDELPLRRRARLLRESDWVAGLLRSEFGATKINVAALGNQVEQLHWHVIGRRADDPAWPNPVWGHLEARADWSAARLARIRELFTGEGG
ncbi:MAG: HIT domain-containing protein [Cellvibrionales bacterium]|nr:HIT domain-containing protein [Cellvibrionales bacterium]